MYFNLLLISTQSNILYQRQAYQCYVWPNIKLSELWAFYILYFAEKQHKNSADNTQNVVLQYINVQNISLYTC